MKTTIRIPRSKKVLSLALTFFSVIIVVASRPGWAATPPLPVVAIHVSELTQALESMPAVPPTPTGPGTTGYQWWPSSWHYFVAYESLEEALRSDGTPFVEVSDADIAAGHLLYADGSPRYPILISLASEAIADNEIQPLRDYVSNGGFLFIGSSAFTRNPDGSARGDFALAAEMGLHIVYQDFLQNFYINLHFTKVLDHRLAADIPSGELLWRMPLSSEEIPLGDVTDHSVRGSHYVFDVSADSGTTVIANGDSGPLLTTTPYGSGNIIYHGAMQPLIGHTVYDPSMYAYLIYRHAIEWAFEAANVPIIKLSPMPYEYNAAFIVRHDFENYADSIRSLESSASFDYSHGAKGDYYFCTGTLREEMPDRDTVVASLRRAVTNYGATIGSHNGGLKNPVSDSLSVSDFDYWHWGPDEALDVTPPGYPSGAAYAKSSVSESFQDIEGWLAGTDNGRPGCGSAGNCPRTWVAPYMNSTREASFGMLEELGVVSTGEQKIGPFPTWNLSTQTRGKRYNHIAIPTSGWYVGTEIPGALEWGHTAVTMQAAVDFYYNLGASINLYGHEVSSDSTLKGQYVEYCITKPRMWSANAVELSDWWRARSHAGVTASYSVTGNTADAEATITGATDPDTAVEVEIPNGGIGSNLQVLLNGAPADPADYRIVGNAVKILVGSSPSVAEVQYTIETALDHVTISPSSSSITAGGSRAYTAEAFDQGNNSLGDVTASTTFTILPDGSCTGASCTASVAGTHSVTGTYADKTSPAATLEVSKVEAVVTLTPGSLSRTYDGTPKAATATTDPAGLNVTFTYDGSSTAPTNAGSYAVVATISDDTYQGSANGTLTISKANQTITFGPLADRSILATPFTIGATASSGLTVSFSSQTSSVCTVTGNTVTLKRTGICTIRASQGGNTNYNAATPVDQSFNVSAASVRIDGTPPAYYGTVQAAFDAAVGGDTIQAQNLAMGEDLDFNPDSAISIAFEGGYNTDFTSRSGSTTISSMIVTSGCVTVDMVTIQ